MTIVKTFRHVQSYLSNVLEDLRAKKGLKSVAFLTKNVHVLPDFHGNRSPFADPTITGMVSIEK